MQVQIRIATAAGWQTIVASAPDGSDVECYALPRANGEVADRAAYWSRKTGRAIPRGRGLIWSVV
jgi:hypothetical protein